ncbi:MAG: NAD(+)/NADH kinase [Candidatus Nitrosocosmicus sp.]|uniref:NAD(+)/NADH kinase n=1 Tax=Candidatus Nitrosocosmicus agrestis TaxID=2563600 RepID=UPI0013312B74|nr:NAD(+)/NADH kinase [Candidatus Nitrosocosmicus sp. SS]MDR4492526.1 NAD(+)/NADH kinase [Candidatus Nitrosocosmicus sp.]
MNHKIRCVAIFTKRNNEEAKTVTSLLKEKIKGQGIEVIEFRKDKLDFPGSDVDEKLDLAIAVGGDGTTIKAFRLLPHNVPVLCINAGGTRGILSEVSKNFVESILDPLINGKYFTDRRIRIIAHYNNRISVPVINDFVLMRSELNKTPMFHICVNGDSFGQKMDGIIVSTPTGSTGHSLSNNGPVIQENLECLLLTPIASVNRMPPFVLPMERITISASHDTQLVMDGQITQEIPKNTEIKIVKYAYDAVFLRFKKNNTRQLNKLGYNI